MTGAFCSILMKKTPDEKTTKQKVPGGRSGASQDHFTME
jgi:hypothetical protein